MLPALSFISVVMMSAQPSAPPIVLPREAHAQGWTRARLERAYDRMGSPPLSNFDFAMSDVSFKLTRRFTEYSGDISGRLLSALMTAGPALGRDSAIVPEMMAAMGAYQKADGHFGADQDLKTGIRADRDMPILWGNSRLLLAFTQRYATTRDTEALRLARGIGDYVISTRPYLGKPENLSVGGAYAAGYTTCYPSLIEGMARLAEVSGESKYLEEARNIARIALQDTSFEKHHSHGRLASYRGMLEIDRIGKTTEFLPAVKAGVAKVTRELVLPTGGITELFDRTDVRDEGCSEVDWIMVNVLLWRATGETGYLDMAEHTLRNHLLAVQFPNGGFGHHTLRFLKSANGAVWAGGGVENVGAEAYWCCSEHGTQVLGDLTRWAVVTDGKSVYVTFLAEAQTRVMVANQLVSVSVREPNPGLWQIELSGNTEQPIELKLRVPYGFGGLVIDDKSLETNPGWATVSVRGKPASKLTAEFSKSLVRSGPYSFAADPGKPSRVLVGQDLYCLPDASVPDGFLAKGQVPVLYLAEGKITNSEIPVIVQGGPGGRERLRTRLVPMMQRPMGGCLCLFDVRKASAGEIQSVPAYERKGVPIEFLFACDGQCEILINGKSAGTRQGWGENSRMEMWVPTGPLEVTIKAESKAERPALIGFLTVGKNTYVTNATDWSAVAGPTSRPADQAINGLAGSPAIKLEEIGGYGDPPGKHVVAEFAGTGARWVWAARTAAPDQPWALTCRIESGRKR